MKLLGRQNLDMAKTQNLRRLAKYMGLPHRAGRASLIEQIARRAILLSLGS